MCSYLVFLVLVTIEWGLICKTNGKNIEVPNSTKEKKIFISLVCFELIIFVSMRADSIGADTTLYVSALDYYKSLPQDAILTAGLIYPFDFEPGYFLLTKLCAWLSLSHAFFFAIVGAIIYIPLFKFIERNSENALISLLVYFAFGFFGYSLGIFRQMIAVSITLCGTVYLKEHKLAKYVVIVFIAPLFHTTAIIVLPLYWLYRFNIQKTIKYIFVMEIFAFIFGRKIIEIFLKIFPSYAHYIGSQYDVQGGSYVMLIVLNILMILGTYASYYNKNFSPGMQLAVAALMIACVLQVMGYSMGIFGRIVPYYSIYSIVLIPALINNFFTKHTRWIARVILAIMLILMFYLLTYNETRLCPYVFSWN